MSFAVLPYFEKILYNVAQWINYTDTELTIVIVIGVDT